MTEMPTPLQACWTAVCSALPEPNSSPAASNVASAASWKFAVAESFFVRAAYQILPARSQAKPPRIVAARKKAWFGMPELMWTPPLSSSICR